MHAGNHFSFSQVIYWTRRDIIALLLFSSIPTSCYVLLEWKWLAIPWLPIALLGTAVAFVVGFKNNASYDRLWEARRAWGAIVNYSRSWGIMTKDFITSDHAIRKPDEMELQKIHFEMINRHLAWITALRFQLRESRTWEAMQKKHNLEYRNKWFKVAEHHQNLQDELKRFLSPEEIEKVMRKSNKAAYILTLQSAALRRLKEQGLIEDFRHMELEKILVELYNQQGVCERIKNFPYPRQYASLNLYFIRIFVGLVPFGMLQEFDQLGDHMVWLAIPFSALSAWIFTTMEKIGESTESPFEGSANDVPITAISRSIEIDLREFFDEKEIPAPLKPENDILL